MILTILFTLTLLSFGTSQYCQTTDCRTCVGLAYGNYDETCGWCATPDGGGYCMLATSDSENVPSHANCSYWIPYSTQNYQGALDSCNSIPSCNNVGQVQCQNGGVFELSTCSCSCQYPWGGYACDINVMDTCHEWINCLNGGNLDISTCSCKCNGWTGKYCDVELPACATSTGLGLNIVTLTFACFLIILTFVNIVVLCRTRVSIHKLHCERERETTPLVVPTPMYTQYPVSQPPAYQKL